MTKTQNTNHTTKAFTLVELLVVIAIISSLSALSAPIIIKQISKSRATTALSNGKDIYSGIRQLNLERNELNLSATTSLDYFNKLFATKAISDEKPFFIKGTPSTAANPKYLGNEDSSLTTEEISNWRVLAVSPTVAINVSRDSPNTPVLCCPAKNDSIGEPIVNQNFENWFGDQAVVITADGGGTVYSVFSASTANRGKIQNPTDGTIYMAGTIGQSPYPNPWTGSAGLSGAFVQADQVISLQP